MDNGQQPAFVVAITTSTQYSRDDYKMERRVLYVERSTTIAEIEQWIRSINKVGAINAELIQADALLAAPDNKKNKNIYEHKN